MRARSYLTLGVFFLLAGCGTLKISIDYGNTPAARNSATSPGDTPAIGAMLAATPTSSVTPSPSETRSASPTNSPSAEPDNGIIAVAAGNSHTCAVTASGRVKCWGDNENGQLGNGTMVNSAVPVDVTGLTDAKAITSGWRHTCALTAGGGVKCWGYNRNGELGNGSTEDSNRPSDVKDLSAGVVAIDAGDNHTCAVTASGGVKCWGYNDYGQLGDGTKSSRSVPVESAGFSGGVAEVVAGWGHTCVRTTGGGAKCWGNNEFGQLGDGEKVDGRLTPVDVIGLTYGVLKITTDGGQSCALTTGGGVSCWGNNKYGQLGDGSGQQRNIPVQVIGLTSGVSDVISGWNHTCAVISGGGLECWGWNYYGQLGDGTKITQSKPAHVYRLTDGVRDIATGWAHTCVATDLGAVKCWGENNYGQLGDGTQSESGIPLTVVGLGSVPVATNTISPTPVTTGALAISTGDMFTCALMSDGGVKCWGDNFLGELGNGSGVNSAVPISVNGLGGPATAIANGGGHACALIADGTMKCWGRNYYGQLGGGFATGHSGQPVDVENVHDPIRSITLGSDYTCVLTGSGGVKCWGGNSAGQLGNGTNKDSKTQVDVVGLSSGVIAISARFYSTCALTNGGAVKCWGRNAGGLLGDGTTTDRNTPVNVVGLTSGIVSISVGWVHACALTDKGGAKCWGDNTVGQLGNGTTSNSEIPVDVIEPANDFLDVKAGGITCARTKTGGVKCWGSDPLTFVGDAGAWTIHNRPVDIVGLSSGVAVLELGNAYACTVSTDAIGKCWGWNLFGQLGDGTKVNRSAPGVVINL